MKIGFWSNVHGQAGTTTNLIATSVMSCLLNHRKVAVLQSHFSMNNLVYPLAGVESNEDFIETGIDALMRDFKTGKLTEKVTYHDSFSLIENQYHLFAETAKKNREPYENAVKMYFNKIINSIEQHYDQVYIDIASGYEDISLDIISNVDIIVVNLSQNKKVIEDYLRQPIVNKPVIYLFGNYNYNSKYNIKNLRRSYDLLKKNNCCSIHYNCELNDAINDGRVIKFLQNNMDVARLSNNYDFIQSIRDVVRRIDKESDKICL